MAFTATRAGECFDCQKPYKEGDILKPNGHKTKAGKDYYCPDGEGCKGAMQLQGSPKPIIQDEIVRNHPSMTPDNTAKNVEKEPTPIEMLALAKELLLKDGLYDPDDAENKITSLCIETRQKIAVYLVREANIRKAMDKLRIKHPGRVAFSEGVLK